MWDEKTKVLVVSKVYVVSTPVDSGLQVKQNELLGIFTVFL